MPTQKLWVKGLKQEDERPIEQRLKELDGVFYAVLNHQDECAEVDFEDDRASLAEIRAALREMGYESQVAG